MPTVSVACKIPNGLTIKLGGKPFTLNGSNVAFTPSPNRIMMPGVSPGGFGITHDVDQALFDEWLAKHKDYGPVKDGLIFASAKPNDVKAQALEKKDLKSGLEALDPDKPAPGMKKYNANDKE